MKFTEHYEKIVLTEKTNVKMISKREYEDNNAKADVKANKKENNFRTADKEERKEQKVCHHCKYINVLEYLLKETETSFSEYTPNERMIGLCKINKNYITSARASGASCDKHSK